MARRPDWLGRIIGEFLVIILGVLVALSVDRWIQRVDDGALRENYLDRLVTALRADSATLADMVDRAQNQSREAGLLLELIEGAPLPDSIRPLEMIRRFEMIAWYSPLDYSRDAWDDLLATGNAALFEPGLRLRVSVYYNALESTGLMEEEWDRQLGVYEDNARDVQRPITRLRSLGRAGLVPESAASEGPLTDLDLRRVLEELRARPRLHAELGHVALIWQTAARFAYDPLLALNNELLASLRDGAT